MSYWFWVAVYAWIAWRWLGPSFLALLRSHDELLDVPEPEQDLGSGEQAD